MSVLLDTSVVVGEPIARQAGEMGRAWRRSHPGISVPDLVIPATAGELGMDLATLNVRHFPNAGRAPRSI